MLLRVLCTCVYDQVLWGLLSEAESTDVSVPPIGPDELPPPYTATPQGGIPMINCRVCQAMVNIEGKQHLHVVKCSVCQEATVRADSVYHIPAKRPL